MAKQRGIHQISGKINNLCYYEQKYVRGGLIRRINEAMSGRLKTDPAFANTRVANRLFGGCSLMAKALLSAATWRLDTLAYPSRQAKLTSSLLSMVFEAYGRHAADSISWSVFIESHLINALDEISKTKIYTFFPEIGRIYNRVSFNSEFDIDISAANLYNYAKYCGVNSLQIEVSPVTTISDCEYSVDASKYIPCFVESGRIITTVTWRIDDGDISISARSGDQELGISFVFVSILPVISGGGATVIYKKSYAIGAFIKINYE